MEEEKKKVDEGMEKNEDRGGSLNKKSQVFLKTSRNVFIGTTSMNSRANCRANCTTDYSANYTTNYSINCSTTCSTNCSKTCSTNCSTTCSTNCSTTCSTDCSTDGKTNYNEMCLPNRIVTGNFSQGDSRFNIHSRGKQCTCNAFAFLAAWNRNKDLTKDIIDLILYEGDRLYYNATFHLLQRKQMHEFLSFTDLLLLQPVQLYDQLCTFTLGQVYSGTLNCTTNLNEARFGFEDAVKEILAVTGEILVMIGTYAMAMVKYEGKIALFDSHAHSSSGMFHNANGKAAFMIFSEVSRFTNFIRANFATNSLFEFQVVQLSFKQAISPFQSEHNCETTSKIQRNTGSNMKVLPIQSMVTYLQKQNQYTCEKRNKRLSDTGILPVNKRPRQSTMIPYSHTQSQLSGPKMQKKFRQQNGQTSEKNKSDLEKREKRRERDRKCYRKKMSDPETQNNFSKKSKQEHKKRMSDPEKKSKFREQNKQVHEKRMYDLEKQEKHRAQGRERYRDMKSDPEQLEKCRERKREQYKKRISDPEKLEKFREQKREQYRKRMSDPEKREKIREKKRECYRKMKSAKLEGIKKINDELPVDTNEVSQSISKDCETLHDIIQNFHLSLKGPVFVCSCCHQTWFKHCVTDVSTLTRSSIVLYDHLQRCLTGFVSEQNKEWICHTCKQTILKGKVPKLSVLNSNRFPDKPIELNLYQLEERLISLRIPFMQIRELPRGGQLSIKGNVVNVPTDIIPTITALPRSMDENETIPVKLKKRLSYKKHDFVENVRPIKVLCALHWLVQNSPLYKEANIQIDHHWLADLQNFTSREQLEFMEGSQQIDEELSEEGEDSDSSDNFSEIDEKDIHHGNADTLLEDANVNGDNTYMFAPGEGQVPLSMFSDADAEYLSFPTIFCGQRRTIDKERLVPIHYSDICKWELRCVDRRVSQSVPNLFFKLKKLQMKQINDKVNLSIRRCKTKGKKITVGSLLDENSVNNLVNLDEGFRVFRTLRNSPPYLESKKKDLFALIRQLGLPTFFMSLSAADTRWPELLITLGKLVDNKDYSVDDICEMDWAEKSRLIQSDPVTCARFFDFRVKQFIHNVLKSPCAPLGIIEDSFLRVEFQQRGSAHIHMLLWIKDAPVYGESSDEDVISFIDQNISVSADVDPDLKQYLDYQIHKHSKTCRKGGRPVCRFGHPKPPMPKTMILTPFDPLDEDEFSDEHEKNLMKIQNMLGNAYQGDDITFAEFLENLELDEEQYIKAIRTSLKGPTVFLKRSPSEVRVNMYMKHMLGAWQANHDLQFVLDAYACAVYIVSYISKSEGGMSSLMHSACKEAKQGNKSLKEQVRHIGNKFSNAVEISAQEAAYLVLQLPLTQSSRKVIFIPTSPPDERTFLVKSLEQLQEMSHESTDIQCGSLIQRYSQRPRQLEKWCLADFTSYLTIKWPQNVEVEDPYEECHQDDVCQDHNAFKSSGEEAEVHEWPENPTGTCEPININLKNGIVIKQRKKPLVIRYVRYSKKVDPENYCRERILLFHPWRKEELDIKAGFFSFEAHYETIKNIVERKASNYEHNAAALENAMADAHEEMNDQFDKIAPEKEQIEQEDLETGAEPSENFRFFEPPNKQKSQYDIGPDIGLAPSSACDNTVEYLVGRIPEEQYLQIIRSLNIKQMEFFTHVLQSIKMDLEQLKLFLTGGAGVGKSVLITALYQALHRILYSTAGENPEEVRILLCAPTGKAAYNIGGCTIHSAFKIPANQRIQYKSLSSDTINSVRMKYRKLSMVIIDEVSMVGNRMFNFINLRLQEIKCCKKPFGGVHMILVGDLFQLPPVNDGWIFRDLDRGYGPLAVNIWQDAFHMYQLDEIMRQKDDYEFALILNRIRKAQHTENDIEVLNRNVISSTDENYPYDYPHFFRTRKEVQQFNEAVFHQTVTEKVIVVAQDSVSSDLPQAVKTIILDRVKSLKNHSDTGQLMLLLPVSLQYMCTVNINVEDGIVNGSEGILRKIEYLLPQSSLPSILWLEFHDKNIGRQTRADYKQFYTHGTNPIWTPIFAISRTFLRSAGKVTVIRKQFPLEPCAAKTIHKSQGSTYDRIVVDLGTTKLAHSHYVALSRVRTLAGLKILKLNSNKIAVDSKVVDEMTKLQKTPFKLCYTPLYQYQQTSFKILFHNVRSAHKHFPDFCNNENYRVANMLGIAESRLYNRDLSENFEIPSFSIYRNDQEMQGVNRPPHGLLTYYKTNQNIPEIKHFSSVHFEFTFCKFRVDLGPVNFQLQVINLYLSQCPDTVFTRSMMILQDILDPQLPFIMLGDFNHNANEPLQKRTSHIEALFACKQTITLPTHDSGSTLDQIYTNIDNQHIVYSAGVIDCCWSDHKAIYAVLSP